VRLAKIGAEVRRPEVVTEAARGSEEEVAGGAGIEDRLQDRLHQA
jgi:hypothetical protein